MLVIHPHFVMNTVLVMVLIWVTKTCMSSEKSATLDNCRLHRSNVPENNLGTLHILVMSKDVVTTSPKSIKALEILLDNDLMCNDYDLQMAVA